MQRLVKDTWEVVLGRSPPPIRTIPPTAVRPEMAFVTDISGECSEGVTPHTVCQTFQVQNLLMCHSFYSFLVTTR